MLKLKDNISKSNFLILILLIHLISCNNISFSQNVVLKLDWNDDTLVVNNRSILVPNQFHFDFFTAKISNKFKFDLPKNVSYKNVSYEIVSDSDLVFINENNIRVDSTFKFNFHNSYDQNELFLYVDFSAFVFVSDKLLKVISVEFDFKDKNQSINRKRGGHLNSVLADENSKWFKFRVDRSGFFKLTYSQLNRLGFDVKNLGFSAFHVYGNGSGRLPELNSEYNDLDLIQNSVFYQGIDDGVFNEGDAIVFYAADPHKVYFDSDSLLVRDLNIYSDFSSYFLRVSTNVKPKLVDFKDNSTLNSDIITESFQHHEIHELEDTSLVYAGKRWYGELLDFQKSVDIKFDHFQTNLEELTIQLSGATNARIYGSYLNIYLDDLFIKKINLPSVSSEYIRVENSIKIDPNSGFNRVKIELVRNSPDTKFFIDKVEINTFQELSSYNENNVLTNAKIIGKGVVQYNFPNLINGTFIDVTNPTELIAITPIYSNNTTSFKDNADIPKFYKIYNFQTVSSVESTLSPVKIQNLHNVDFVDMIIVTPQEFINQANELMLIHQEEGLRTVVVTDEEIYNEFSSGEMDPTAIKQFARSVYMKQKNNSKDRLKYLLLFGDGTFDYKNRVKGNNNFIPTYQFEESEDFLSAMVSDDYFGMMDDDESMKGVDLLDICVGRMLISSQQQADEMLKKIKEYINKNQSQTDWRTKIVLIADDEEGGYFINNDTEPQSRYLNDKHPEINVVKLYSDAFQQVTTAGGERFPSLNTQIDNQFYNGALVISYVGHGGPSGAAEERIISIDQVSNYKNLKNMPLFMSSTCEFTKYDDPTRVSAGEVLYLNPSGGAIALMTTTRPVFFGVNTISGSAFFKNVLQYDSLSNSSLTFGEIFRRTKNQSGTSSNRRSFTLIGDPALKISYPVENIIIDSINDTRVNQFHDTLKALSKVNIKGHVSNRDGSKALSNGNLFLTLYDKKNVSATLGQNQSSPIINFENQNSILFKGLVSVIQGDFSVDFILPKDIDYSIGKGKISVVSFMGDNHGIGYLDSFLIGGISNNFIKDSIGPEITLSFDSLKQIENGVFPNNIVLYANLKDDSGINISSSGIGHQISLVIDDQTTDAIDLNAYYVADKNTFKSGKIQYRLPELSTGKHTLRLKAWDVHNNSSEKELNFNVNQTDGISLNRVFNYPNPFTTKTSFYIEQNVVDYDVDFKLDILTISGKLVKSFSKENMRCRSNVEQVFEWDGLDEFGDQLAKGVYIYRITLSDNRTSTTKMEKLVIF